MPDFSPTTQPIVSRSSDGRLELFFLGLNLDGAIYHIWQLAQGGWSAWYSHGKVSSSGFQGPPAIGSNADGRLELFAADIDTRELYHKWQLAPNRNWSSWFPFPRVGSGLEWQPAVAEGADGRLEAFNVVDGNVYHTWQLAPNNAWSDWFNHGQENGGFRSTPSVWQNADGRLQMFAFTIGVPNLLYTKWQVAVNSVWSDWVGHPGMSGLGNQVDEVPPVMASNLDGRIELFTLSKVGNLLHTWQVAPDNGWSDWFDHGAPGGSLLQTPTLARNQDGRLELRVAAADGIVYGKSQVAPNAQWGTWFPDSPRGISSPPRLIRASDGRLFHFVFGANGNLYYKSQLVPNGAWSDWESLGHP